MMTHDGVVFRGLWHRREIELIACYILHTPSWSLFGPQSFAASHRSSSFEFQNFLTLVWSPLIQPYIHTDAVSPLVDRR